MANFDMRGQHVNNQYNAGHDINFGAVQNANDFISELENLKNELAQNKASGVVPEETAIDTDYQITKAIQQAKKSKPDKKILLDHLITAKVFIEDITAASGLATAVIGAIEVGQKLFS